MNSPGQINDAVHILLEGGVIAYPTEAVYGLGCDPQNLAAVERLLRVKQRDPEKGLILIAADFKQLTSYLDSVDADLQQKVFASWPGPVTWLWPAKQNIPSLLKGKHKTIAVRVTNHPLVAELCRVFGGAIVSTSANLSDQPAARSAEEVRSMLGDSVDFIVEGETGGLKQPSEIRDVMTGEILRKG